MNAFKALLLLMFVGIVTYTALAGSAHGWDLLSVFIADLGSLTWPGQFDFDFSCYLTLSALWIAWRHEFSGSGIALALIGQVAGILFFAPYLLWALRDADSDMKKLLLGARRAHA